MLGSNLADDTRIHGALATLSELGFVECLGPVRHLRPREGRGPHYYNVLAVLHSPLEGSQLDEALSNVEHALGRRRGSKEVAIDIDLLATEVDGLWRASHRATVKEELHRWPARHLLEVSGIRVHAS